MDIRTFILLLVYHVSLCSGLCPHQEPGLTAWSSDNSLPQTDNDDPNLHVVIDKAVLLDTSPAEFGSLEIASGGRLVWSPDGDYTMKLNYIHIHGRLDIGSEDCKFDGKAKIILKGGRGEHNIPGFGEKFIGVDKSGTLEIHGKQKLSWTKLTNTIPKLTGDNGIVFDHETSSNLYHNHWYEGVAMYIVDIPTKHVEKFVNFYISGNHAWLTHKGIGEFVTELSAVPDGKTVMVAAQNTVKRAHSTIDLTPVYDALERLAFGSVTGQSVFRTVGDKDAYTMIATAGRPSLTQENVQRFHTGNEAQEASLSFVDWNAGLKLRVKSRIHNAHSWLNSRTFRLVNTNAAYPILDVIDDTSTWLPGDEVVLTSTDFSWYQAEPATVIDCPTCTSNQVRIDFEAGYTHFAEVIHNVDMRGEIALLTRNVVIEGEIQDHCPTQNGNCGDFKYDTFGGHVKALKDFANMHVEGAELKHMGQQTDLGRYPLHFHMCEDVDGTNYPNPPYLRDNSIHHTFARCTTIHGTHGVTVMDNVCYDSLGHGYFLEDGGEKRTVFDGNLGAVTRKASLIPSDERPSTFWITNPLTTVINNVAAGSEAMGFWFLFPDEPIGPSAGKGFMQKGEAHETAITRVENNVAHSNGHVGLMIDGKLTTDGGTSGTNAYKPKVYPLNTTKPYDTMYKEVIVDRMTAYKNFQNMWTRGGWLHLRRASSSDGANGLTMATSGPSSQYLTDSVMLGETSNIGEPTRVWNQTTSGFDYFPRALAAPWDYRFPITGFIFYDGPSFAKNVWFNYFYDTENYTMGAIGFKKENKHDTAVVSGTRNIQLGFSDPAEGNLVYDGDETVHGFGNLDGDKGATYYSPETKNQIVKPDDFYVTDKCVLRPNWNMAICPEKYGKLAVIAAGADNGKTFPMMVRDDIPHVTHYMNTTTANQFLTKLGGTHSYTLHWTASIPAEFYIFAHGVERDHHVRVGLCIPKNANFDLWTYSPQWRPSISTWTEVFTMEDLDSDAVGDRYMYDEGSGLLFLKFLSYTVRTEEMQTRCTGHCPMVRVRVTGDRSVGDCRADAYPTYQRPATLTRPLYHWTDNLPATSAEPPAHFGAGETRPFTTRTGVDGGFSNWSKWSSCSNSCGQGTRKKTRKCDNPPPTNGGKPCSGDTTKSEPCTDNTCLNNGGWSNWSVWSACTLGQGCQGYMTRDRTCDNPAPKLDGLFCQGTISEQKRCDSCIVIS